MRHYDRQVNSFTHDWYESYPSVVTSYYFDESCRYVAAVEETNEVGWTLLQEHDNGHEVRNKVLMMDK
jgi:hypothetical protein